MSITVETKEHGKVTVERAVTFSSGYEGELSLSDQGGSEVAAFANGHWVWAYISVEEKD